MKASRNLLSIILIILLIMSFTVMALAQDTEIVNIKVCCRAKTPMEDWRVDIFFVAAQVLNADLEARGDPRSVEVEVVQVNLDWSVYVNQFVHDYDAGEAPDIWLTGHEYIGTQAEAGRIIALDEMIREFPIFNLVFDTLWDCTKYKGKIWGVPQDAEERLLLYWSKSLLKQIGWSNEEIEALPEKIEKGEFTLYDMLETAKQAVDNDVVEPGSGFWTRPNNGPDFTAFYYAFGGETIDPATGKLVFDKTTGLKYYKFFYDAVQKCEFMHLDPGYRFGIDWGKAWYTEVSESKVLFWVGGTSQWVELAEIYLKDLGGEMYAWENFGFGLIPAAEKGGKPNSLAHPLAHPLVYVINSQCKHQDLALALLRILQSQTEYKFYKGSRLLSEALYMLDYTTFLPNSPYWETYSAITYEALAAVVSGTFTPEEAVDFVVEGLNRELGDKTPEPKVLHESTVKLPMLGRLFEVRKVMDLTSGYGHEIAVDAEGMLVKDLGSILLDEEKAYFERYGKIHPTLHKAIEEASAEDPIPVALWALVEEDEVDKSKFDTESLEQNLELLLAYREQNHRAREGVVNRLHDALGIICVEASDTAPVLYLELTSNQIHKVASWDQVAGLFLHETEGIDNLSNSMRDSNAINVVNTQRWRATNIRVGVWESGPDILANLSVAAHYDARRSATSQHARLVTAIIKNIELGKPHGYAPDARVYSANKYTQAALEWVVTGKECRVINQSFCRWSEQGSGLLSSDDIFKDYLILHYPYPTIVQAAGNFPPTTKNEFVNCKGYNSLAVGNHDDNVIAMSGSSVFRNPTSTHRDRELPELCANGTCVSAVGLMMSGTSFASPAVAGSAALLQNMDNTLLYWPEGNRAILLAGAGRNVSGNTWIQDLGSKDGSDGSGALDIDESGKIARSRQGRNNAATIKGWDVGTLHQSDFDSKDNSTFSYRVQVPATGSRRRVKVALAWNSKVTTKLSGGVTTYLASRLTLDYDLHIYDGNRLVADSSSWDNSYEIAEFTAEPGKVYTIKIRKWSGTGWSWYGIAWTVH